MTTMRHTFEMGQQGIRQLADFDVGGQTYTLEYHESIEAVQNLGPQWQALEASCKDDFTFFQTFSWCAEYYNQFANDLTNRHCPLPQVFVLRKNQVPIMLWPMMRIQSRTGIKILTTATEPLGQYCNFLSNNTHFDDTIGKEALRHILDHANAHVVSFNYYPVESLIGRLVSDIGIKENSDYFSSILEFGEFKSWDEYYRSLSKSQRKDRRRTKSKLEAKGTLGYAVYEAGDADYAKYVAKALEMKTKWLEKTGRKPGILAEDLTCQMFSNLEMSKTEKGEGPLVHVLLLDGAPIAIELGIVKAEKYCSYLGAIDWSLKDYGPGKVQMEMAQEWCFENGIKSFDLLHDPSGYKASWTNTQATMESRNVALGKRGYVYSILWKTYIRPKLKKAYHFAGKKNRKRVNKLVSLVKR